VGHAVAEGGTVIERLLITLALVFCCAHASATEQPCTQTFSNTTGLVTAVTNAANGDVICLNNGTYGSVNFNNISSRTGFVTIRSTSGVGASIAPQISNSRYLRFLNLTFSAGITVDGNCPREIQFVNSAFVGGTEGIYLDGSACTATTHNFLVDGVNFTNTGRISIGEGRLSLRAANGAIIRNSLFSGGVAGAVGDGIQLIDDSQNVTIGPGNEFTNIKQATCDGEPGPPHCDPIQLVGGVNVTVTGNFLHDNTTGFMMGLMTGTTTISDNIVHGDGEYGPQINLWTCTGMVINITHNTVLNGDIRSEYDNCGGSTNGVTVADNIVDGTLSVANGSTSWAAANVHHNLFGTSPGVGTNNITGSATLTGGSGASTWAGHKLTSGSLGKGNASDSKDRGEIYFNPAAPANIR
jgi:hypothetical protein